MNEVLKHVVSYIDRRTSNQVQMISRLPDQEAIVRMNASLFEWVIENLCKNAVDAMEGKGTITLTLYEEPQGVAIEVQDTGKGIKKKDLANVFTPGFTTKKRGWGLGLSLTYRYKSNFAWRLFCDYDYTEKTFTMTYDPYHYLKDGLDWNAYTLVTLLSPKSGMLDPIEFKKSKKMNYFTLGFSFLVNL